MAEPPITRLECRTLDLSDLGMTFDEYRALREIVETLKLMGWTDYAMHEDQMPRLHCRERDVRSLRDNLDRLYDKDKTFQIYGHSIGQLCNIVGTYFDSEYGVGNMYVFGHGSFSGSGDVLTYTAPTHQVVKTRRWKEILQIRKACLAEFERIHGVPSEEPAPEPPAEPLDPELVKAHRVLSDLMKEPFNDAEYARNLREFFSS